MPLKRSTDFLSCGDIPECDGVVTTARNQYCAIGTETDTCNRTPQSIKSADFLAGGDIPEFNGVVTTARS